MIHDKYDEFSKLLNDSLLLNCGGYNSNIDFDIFNVMKLSLNTSDTIYSINIAKKLNLDEKYVELIKYILCSRELANYGSSPRGAWLEPSGEKLLTELIKLKQEMENEHI